MHNRTEDWILESKYKNTWTRKLKSNSYLNCSCFFTKVVIFINFLNKGGKDTKNKLQKLISVENKRVFAKWQKNACNNENNMLKCISQVLTKYSLFGLKWRALLVLDNATSHMTSKVKEKLNECNTSLSMIPSGLTWEIKAFRHQY